MGKREPANFNSIFVLFVFFVVDSFPLACSQPLAVWRGAGHHSTTKDTKNTKEINKRLVGCHLSEFVDGTAYHAIGKLVEFHLRALRVLRGGARAS